MFVVGSFVVCLWPNSFNLLLRASQQAGFLILFVKSFMRSTLRICTLEANLFNYVKDTNVQQTSKKKRKEEKK